MTSTKFFDAFSLVVTRGHSWSTRGQLVVTRGHSSSLVVIRGHWWSLVCTFRHDRKLVCLQFGMFFCCIVAFSVGKVGGIVRRFSVFSMLSRLS